MGAITPAREEPGRSVNTYRITARVPWGIERYLVAAPNHLAACALVENTGQPYGQPEPVAILWEIVESERK